MRRVKKFLGILLIGVPVVISIACGSLILSDLFGKCDFDNYLRDQKTEAEFFAALKEFERQHNLSLEHSQGLTCTSEGVKVTSAYHSPLSLSKYGISYKLLVSVAYSLNSKEITLQTPDQFSETEDVLNYIDSLGAVIAEFEDDPKVKEFSTKFKGIQGTIYDHSLWIETDPAHSLSQGDYYNARIFYSLPDRSITSYSLPNNMNWREFPEFTIAHEIVNKDLLVGELSNCFISTENKANTSVVFLTTGSDIEADVQITCDDTTDKKYLRLILHPDGSYELESVK